MSTDLASIDWQRRVSFCVWTTSGRPDIKKLLLQTLLLPAPIYQIFIIVYILNISVVDLRDYEDVIVGAVQEFAPGSTVIVCKDCYIVKEQLTQSQAVKIGRKICESDLSQHCIKLSKLFNSKKAKIHVLVIYVMTGII